MKNLSFLLISVGLFLSCSNSEKNIASSAEVTSLNLIVDDHVLIRNLVTNQNFISFKKEKVTHIQIMMDIYRKALKPDKNVAKKSFSKALSESSEFRKSTERLRIYFSKIKLDFPQFKSLSISEFTQFTFKNRIKNLLQHVSAKALRSCLGDVGSVDWCACMESEAYNEIQESYFSEITWIETQLFDCADDCELYYTPDTPPYDDCIGDCADIAFEAIVQANDTRYAAEEAIEIPECDHDE